nr:hypothetical protein [Candidatus Freyrarchaeum guaymaensis]
MEAFWMPLLSRVFSVLHDSSLGFRCFALGGFDDSVAFTCPAPDRSASSGGRSGLLLHLDQRYDQRYDL